MRESMLDPQRVDMIGEDCERLPIGVVRELQEQFGVNHGDSDDKETWFQDFQEEETEAGNLPVYDAAEFFERFIL